MWVDLHVGGVFPIFLSGEKFTLVRNPWSRGRPVEVGLLVGREREWRLGDAGAGA